MNVIGVGQKYPNQILGKINKIGNNLGMPEPALRDTLADLEEEIEEETGASVKLPLDIKNSEILMAVAYTHFRAHETRHDIV